MPNLPSSKHNYAPSAIIDLYPDVPRPTSAEEVREEQGLSNFRAVRAAKSWAEVTGESENPDAFALGVLKGILLYQNYIDQLAALEEPQ